MRRSIQAKLSNYSEDQSSIGTHTPNSLSQKKKSFKKCVSFS